ncbi:MAG: hypothetical protein NEA02_16730 [Thermoanaerobaculia bacterium]|nr:hypothetical protein [Thermoanaerobaculia bacterium]
MPVEFKNLNAAVTMVDVRCSLTGKDPITLLEKTVGGEIRALPVTGGNYTGPSPLTFTFLEGTGAVKANSQSKAEVDALKTATGGSCEFRLLTQSGADKPTAGDTRPVFAQKPGTPFKQKVNFTFP